MSGSTGRMKALMKWLLHSAIDASDGKFNQFALFFSRVSMLKWKSDWEQNRAIKLIAQE